MLFAGNVWHARTPASRDQNTVSCNLLAVNLDSVVINEPCVSFVNLNAAVFQQAIIDPGQPVDFFILVTDQIAPFEPAKAKKLPAITAGILKLLAEF